MAAVAAVAALGTWWWLGSAVSTPVVDATEEASAPVALASVPLAPAERVDAAIESQRPVAGPPGVAGAAWVRGQLLDATTSQPLGGIMVRWNREFQLVARPDDPGVATDAGGYFEIEVPAGLGSVTIVTDALGYVARSALSLSLRAGQVDELGSAPLRPGRAFPVRVVDVDTGIGVRGVVLWVGYDNHPAPRWSETPAVVTSALHGRCITRALPLVPCTLAIYRGDYELVSPRAFEITAASPQGLTVKVRRRPTIRGVVVDQNGESLAAIGLSTQGMLAVDSVTAIDGTFTLVCRSPSRGPGATVSLSDTGGHLPHAPLHGVLWGASNLRIVLQPSATIPIEVVDDRGAPVENFAITLQRAATFANRHGLRQRGHHIGGRLDVKGVAPSATSLRVVPLDVEWAPSEPIALGEPGADPVRCVVVRRVPCRVLVVRGGNPVVDALVEYVHERLPMQVQHRSELNDPRDRAAPVQPQWPELVCASRTGVEGIASLWRDATQVQRAIRVRVGEEPDVVVREPAFAKDGSALRIELPGAWRVRGRVHLAGRSHTDVTVRLTAGAYEPHVGLQPDGSFESPALPVGPCRIELLLPVGIVRMPVDGFARNVILDSKQPAEVVFDLSTLVAATVRGRVVSDTPLPAGLCIDFVRITTATAVTQGGSTIAADGSFKVEGLLPGTYHHAFRLDAATSVFVPALQSEVIVLVGGEDIVRQLRFVRRKLTVHFVRLDGTPARGHRTSARCAGGRWPTMSLFAPVLNETLVIDPAPALPIEFGGWANDQWSEPVLMPSDRSEAEVTVVVPGV